MIAQVIPLRVDAATYARAIAEMKRWANAALLQGNWRLASQLTIERKALEAERRALESTE